MRGNEASSALLRGWCAATGFRSRRARTRRHEPNNVRATSSRRDGPFRLAPESPVDDAPDEKPRRAGNAAGPICAVFRGLGRTFQTARLNSNRGGLQAPYVAALPSTLSADVIPPRQQRSSVLANGQGLGPSVGSLLVAKAIRVGPQHDGLHNADDPGGDHSQTHKKPDNPADHLIATHDFKRVLNKGPAALRTWRGYPFLEGMED